MKSLLRKEWAQARLNVLGMLVGLAGLWLVAFGDKYLLQPEPYSDLSVLLAAALVVFAGLQLALAQFASESLWKTRDMLVFRASGPAAAFRAKCLVAGAATTLFALGPALVWSAWHQANSPWAEAGLWSRVLAFAQVGTLGWAAWGVGALCCQLRHGWGTRVVALVIAGSSLFGAAALASEQLASAPPWADWLFPLASAGLALVLAWCAGRAFTAGVDEEVALRDGPGLALALGVVLVAGFPLALVGPTVSRFALDRLQASWRHVVETPDGELSLAVAHPWSPLPRPTDPPGASVFRPDWIHWGWPEPDERLALVTRDQPFPLGGSWILIRDMAKVYPREWPEARAFYEARSRRVHVFRDGPDGPRHEILDPACSARTLIVWSEKRTWTSGPVLADLERKTLTLVRVGPESTSLEPLALPGGDEFRGVERLVTRKWAEVGYRPSYENGLLLAGQHGLYRLKEGLLVPYERAVASSVGSIAASDADRVVVRLRSRYARYDALDPTIEVLDAQGQRVFSARLAPPGSRTEGLKALACAASLGHVPLASLASFWKREPWRGRSLFDNPALLGGRRPWLLLASLAWAAWLAWRVRRETRAWGRSPLLGAFWVGATLLLGLVGWGLFRICEPRSVPLAPAERRAARGAAVSASAGPAGPRPLERIP